MKTKKFSKRLVLNKKTIAHLDSQDMGSIKGGDEYSEPIYCSQHTHCWGCPTVICPDTP